MTFCLTIGWRASLILGLKVPGNRAGLAASRIKSHKITILSSRPIFSGPTPWQGATDINTDAYLLAAIVGEGLHFIFGGKERK